GWSAGGPGMAQWNGKTVPLAKPRYTHQLPTSHFLLAYLIAERTHWVRGPVFSAACTRPGFSRSVRSPKTRSPSVARCYALIAAKTGAPDPALAVPFNIESQISILFKP
ncbi:MAG: hypothetical protein COA96_17980, partial [SAR86 cluster bacterium]